VELYYAFGDAVPDHTDVNPYFYTGKVTSLETNGAAANLQRVVFTDVH
jgi:hypothetical protein